MTLADETELAFAEGAARALRRASARAATRASNTTDGADREKHRRDALTWAACAADIAAMAGLPGPSQREGV